MPSQNQCLSTSKVRFGRGPYGSLGPHPLSLVGTVRLKGHLKVLMDSPCSKLPFNNQPPSGTPATFMHRAYGAETCLGLGLWTNITQTQHDLKFADPDGALRFHNLLIGKHNRHKENTKPPKDNGRLSLAGTLRALNETHYPLLNRIILNGINTLIN